MTLKINLFSILITCFTVVNLNAQYTFDKAVMCGFVDANYNYSDEKYVFEYTDNIYSWMGFTGSAEVITHRHEWFKSNDLVNPVWSFDWQSTCCGSNMSASLRLGSDIGPGSFVLRYSVSPVSSGGVFTTLDEKIFTVNPPPCTAPYNMTVTQTGHTWLDLEWVDPTAIENDFYEVFYRETGSMTWLPIENNPLCGMSFILIFGPPPPMASAYGLKPCTTYDFKVKKNCVLGGSVESADFQATTGECGNPYFTPSNYSSGLKPCSIIEYVEYGGVFEYNDNCSLPGGDSEYGYEFLQSSICTAYRNVPQDLVLNVNGQEGTHYVGGWIDYNHNNTFDVPSEEIFSDNLSIGGSCSGASQTYTITIPGNVQTGQTRMRIVTRYNLPAAPHAGLMTQGGRTEDFIVNITDGTGGCASTLIPVISGEASFCEGASQVLSTSSFTSYLWSNGATTSDITISAAGTYTVTATDANSCTATASFTCATIPYPVINGVVTEAGCTQNNGSINLTVNAQGTPAFLWSNGATTQNLNNLSVGSYTVSVTADGGCTKSQSFMVNSTNPPIAITNVSTSGLTGSFTVSGGDPQVNGGNYTSVTMGWQGNPNLSATLSGGPFTHNSIINFTVPQDGNYQILVLDQNGCSGDTTFFVGTPFYNPSLSSGCWTSLTGTGIPTFHDLYDVFFIDDLTGWVVSFEGNIYKTTDGGQNWTTQLTGNSDLLWAIHFTSSQNGWAVGYNGALFRTTNGGQNWTPQPSGTTNGLLDIFFVDSQRGWIVGEQETILATTDGGQNWVTQLSGNADNFLSVHFVNSQTGWVSGSSGKIMKTTNGGQNWTLQNAGTMDGLSNIFFTDSQNGWVSGWQTPTRHTTDGGQNWSPQTSGAEIFLGMTFTDSQTGWMAGIDGKIFKTTNAGQDWVQQNSATTNSLLALHFSNPATGWAVGIDRAIIKYSLSTPTCTAPLLNPTPNSTNVPVNTSLNWQTADGCIDGYNLSIGTSPGGTEILGSTVVNDTVYQPAQNLPPSTTIYVRIAPFNALGAANGCTEYSFTTAGAITPTCDRMKDSLTLVSLYNATGGANWTQSWDLSAPLDTWFGVHVNTEGCVICLDLDGQDDCSWTNGQNYGGNNLQGALPVSLGDFSMLEKLYLSYNDFPGPIPASLGNLGTLKELSLYRNGLTGPIPTTLSQLPNLTLLDLYGNKLSGSIPGALGTGNLNNLTGLYLSDNQLEGPVPTSLNNLKNLRQLYLQDNLLTGSIPNFDFPQLEHLLVYNNHLSGNIPDFQLPKVTLLWLGRNWLSGPIPSLNVPVLENLAVDNNRLTFDGMEYHLNQNYPNGFGYFPQDSVFHDTLVVRQPGQSLDLSLDFDENVSDNKYQWYKDGIFIEEKMGDNNLTINNIDMADAGEWRVVVFNNNLPSLVLFGRAIRLQVGCSGAPSPNVTASPLGCSTPSNLAVSGSYTGWTWSTGQTTASISVSQPGNYTVTVSDINGCTDTGQVTVLPAVNPAAALMASPLGCASPSNIVVTGSFTGWTWSTGQTTASISVSQPGNYTVTVSDVSGCTGTGQVSVSPPEIPAAILNTQPTDCTQPTGTIVLNINSGISPFIFDWSDITGNNNAQNRAGLPSGAYTVTITGSNQCTASVTAQISNKPAPVPVISGPSELKPGDTTMLTVTTVFPTYQWSTGAISAQITIDMPGIYSVTVADNSGCTGTSLIDIQEMKDSVIINVNTTIPKAITPNGDGSNDDFDPVQALINDGYQVDLTQTRLVIYMRNGEAIKDLKPYTQGGWKGEEIPAGFPEGAYYYVLQFGLTNGQTGQIKGSVNLVR